MQIQHALRLLLWIALLQAGQGVQADFASDLVLKTEATRRALFVDLYSCEIYGPQELAEVTTILVQEVPVSIRLTVHGDTPGTLPDQWQAIVDEELSDKLLSRIKKTYRSLTAGDEVVIRYSPGRGSIVEVNGEEVVVDPGRGLMTSVLEQWVGQTPVSSSFKHDLLSRWQNQENAE